MYSRFSIDVHVYVPLSSALSRLGLAIRRLFVELHHVLYVVPATKEDRASLVNALGDDVEDTFCARRCQTSSL